MGIQSKGWRPSNCATRYATTYEFPEEQQEQEEKEEEKPILVDKISGIRDESLWCCGCMRFVIDPFSFECGHTFCKSCIAATRSILVRDFWDSVSDVRARMRCPVGDCTATIAALPLINGDFRFTERRVEKNESSIMARKPKTTNTNPHHHRHPHPPKESAIIRSESAVLRPSTSPSAADHDGCKPRRSDSLFDGLEDMKLRVSIRFKPNTLPSITERLSHG